MIRGKAPAANAFWCILSSKIASGDNFFDYLFQLKKWKWRTLKLAVCLIIESHRKYLTLKLTGIEPLEAAINSQKNVCLKHQTGHFFKVLWESVCGKSHGPLTRLPRAVCCATLSYYMLDAESGPSSFVLTDLVHTHNCHALFFSINDNIGARTVRTGGDWSPNF